MKTFKTGKNFKMGFYCVIEDDVEIGDDVKIGHFVTLKNGTRIGNRVIMADYCCTTGMCYIGNDVNIRTHSTISKGLIIEDRVFIGGGVLSSSKGTIIENKNPINEKSSTYAGHVNPITRMQQLITRVGMGSLIGSSCNLAAGVIVGSNVIVGYASNICKNLIEPGIYYGNPAQKVRSIPIDMIMDPPDGWEPHEFPSEMVKKYLGSA
ncbi:MAG: hypothetical protein KKC50_07990 [Candidatus Omnitrophica bacterium]|nr:hypothetical protein [Candidatus Omnitrophota bacterium]